MIRQVCFRESIAEVLQQTSLNAEDTVQLYAIVKCELAGQMTWQDLHLAFFACVGARYWVALLTCRTTLVGLAVILQAHQAAQGHVICGVGSPRLAGLWRRPDSLLLEPASSVA